MGALFKVAQHIFKRPISPLRSSIDSLIAHMFVRHVVGIFERFSVLLYIQLVNPFCTPCIENLQARQHHAQPLAVLQVVVVVVKGALGVLRRVNEDALDLPPVKRQQGLESLQVVALNKQVVPRNGGIAKNMSCCVRAQHMGSGLVGD